MTAVFGIDELSAKGFVENCVVCYPCTPDGKRDFHNIVSSIKNEDIVFIKRCAPGASLHIKAVGVVKSDFPTENDVGLCLPVEWVWQGEKVLDNLDEVLLLCGDPIYEEHNITVQREITDLLPDKYKLPQVW